MQGRGLQVYDEEKRKEAGMWERCQVSVSVIWCLMWWVSWELPQAISSHLASNFNAKNHQQMAFTCKPLSTWVHNALPYNHNNTPADPSVRQALWLVHSPPPAAVAVVTAWKWRHDPTSCWCPAIMQWTRVLWGGGAVQLCDTVHNTPISSQQSVSSVGLSRQKIAASPSVSESLAAVSRHSELIVVLVTDLSSGQPLTHPVLVNDPPTATPSSDHRKL